MNEKTHISLPSIESLLSEADARHASCLRPYLPPFSLVLTPVSSVPLLMGSQNSGGSHNPSDGGNSGHGSSGDGNDDGGNGHDPSTGEDIGDETPGKGWDFYWPVDE